MKGSDDEESENDDSNVAWMSDREAGWMFNDEVFFLALQFVLDLK